MDADDGCRSFDADHFLEKTYSRLQDDHVAEAAKLRKDVKKTTKKMLKKVNEAEQSPTTLEEVWEHLCSAYGPSPFALEAWKFVDTMYKSIQTGLGSDLYAVVNQISPETYVDLDRNGLAYLCYSVLELGYDSEVCAQELLNKSRDPEFANLRPDDILLNHVDAHLNLQNFRKLIHIITDVLHLEETYILAAVAWVEVQRFEMPEFLYTQFFAACSQYHFFDNQVTSPDADHVAYGQLDQNAFIKMCHSLGLVDHRRKTGREYNFCTSFWEEFLHHIDDIIRNYTHHRLGASAKLASEPKKLVGRTNSLKSKDSHREKVVLKGRTELTAMMQHLFLHLPKGSYRSPFHLVSAYLLRVGIDRTIHFDNETPSATSTSHDGIVRRISQETVQSVASKNSAEWFRKQQKNVKQEMTSLYSALDHKNKGALDYDDLAALLKTGNPNMLDSDIEMLFKMADENNNGVIDFDEFIEFIASEDDPLRLALKGDSAAHSRKKNLQDSNKLNSLKMFAEKDADGSGTLDFDELCDLLSSRGADMTDSEIRGLFDAADADGTGLIDYNEFVEYIWSAPRPAKKHNTAGQNKNIVKPAYYASFKPCTPPHGKRR